MSPVTTETPSPGWGLGPTPAYTVIYTGKLHHHRGRYLNGDDCLHSVRSSDMIMQQQELRRPLAGMMRLADLLAAVCAIALLAPLFLLIALLVLVTSRGGILFHPQRIGLGGRMFTCYKFRSMVVDAEQRLHDLLVNDPDALREWLRDHKLRADPRITPIGNFLRRSSLDELPQLFNVLFGDMSLVGPRPIVVGEMPRYGRYLGSYASVKPGITGLWQISGRNNVSYRRRVAMDVAYARSKSLGLDLRILLATVPAVIGARGSC